MTASTKDLIERANALADNDAASWGALQGMVTLLVEALERLTQPVENVEPQFFFDLYGKPNKEGFMSVRVNRGYGMYAPTYSAETVARLIAERDEWKHEAMHGGHADQLRAERNALQEQVKMLSDSLEEAVKLRVSLWRHGDMEGDDDHLSDAEVAKKEPCAQKWLLALAATEQKEKAE